MVTAYVRDDMDDMDDMETPQWVLKVLYGEEEVRGNQDREPSGDKGKGGGFAAFGSRSQL